MKSLLLFLVLFLAGLAIVLSFHYWTKPQNIFKKTPAFTTKFSLQNAPTESLQGAIATISGSVSWLSRTAPKPIKLTTLRTIQQGEELSTGANGKAVIRIQNDTSLLLLPNTHVSIIQLLPQNFVFVQDKGAVRYENTYQVPVSVKTYDLVTLITKGIVTISIDSKKQTVTVAVTNGTVREGFEDLQNTSNVLQVNAGQTFLFDEATKTETIQ